MRSMGDWMYHQKKNYYIEDATDNLAGNTKFDSTTEQKYTVPDNHRWFVLGGRVKRDAAETLTISVHDSLDNQIMYLVGAVAATGISMWPDMGAASTNPHITFPIVLDGGEYVKIAFGGAQGAAAEASCIVIEVPL